MTVLSRAVFFNPRKKYKLSNPVSLKGDFRVPVFKLNDFTLGIQNFLTEDIGKYGNFTVKNLTVGSAGLVIKTAYEVYELSRNQYSLTENSVPLICWGALFGLLSGDEGELEEWTNEICNGFAQYINSESFKDLMNADCSDCFPLYVYESCLKNFFELLGKVDEPSSLIKVITQNEKNWKH